MNATAKNLISSKVVVVRAEDRLRDAAAALQEKQAQHCAVVDEQTGRFGGVVRLSDVAAFSGTATRIFADLAGQGEWLTVLAEEPVGRILRAFEGDHQALAVVTDDAGRYVGLITMESAWAWLVTRQAEQQQRLGELALEQRRLGDFLENKVEQRTAGLRTALLDFKDASMTLSHDVGGPLRTIKLFASMLETGECGTLNDEGKNYLTRIQGALGKVDTLTREILDRAKRGGELAPAPTDAVDLDEVVADATELLQALVKERGAEIVRRADSLHRVKGRYVPLLQIVSNLLANAVKYVPHDRNPVVEIWSESAADGQVVLFVKDNGRGIRESEMEAVFRPFVRLEEGGEKGSGLGLSIAQTAAEDLGGAIRLQSTEGVGSVFSVVLRALE